MEGRRCPSINIDVGNIFTGSEIARGRQSLFETSPLIVLDKYCFYFSIALCKTGDDRAQFLNYFFHLCLRRWRNIMRSVWPTPWETSPSHHHQQEQASSSSSSSNPTLARQRVRLLEPNPPPPPPPTPTPPRTARTRPRPPRPTTATRRTARAWPRHEKTTRETPPRSTTPEAAAATTAMGAGEEEEGGVAETCKEEREREKIRNN